MEAIYKSSYYTIVDGPYWEDAEANSVKLGGNLAAINNKDENDFIANTYKGEVRFQKESNTRFIDRRAWIGLVPNSQENWKWSNGADFRYQTGWKVKSHLGEGSITRWRKYRQQWGENRFNLYIEYAMTANGKWENGTPGWTEGGKIFRGG